MKTLLVLRHAKSSWHHGTLVDHERPLNERGQREAPQMGKVIREYRLVPDVLLSSDACRARQTAEAVTRAAHFAGEIRLEPRLYGASPAEIIGVLRTVDVTNAATVLIVGHNPGLEELVARLTRERQELPTAALAQIVLTVDQWRDLTVSSRGSLIGLWRPKELV